MLFIRLLNSNGSTNSWIKGVPKLDLLRKAFITKASNELKYDGVSVYRSDSHELDLAISAVKAKLDNNSGNDFREGCVILRFPLSMLLKHGITVNFEPRRSNNNSQTKFEAFDQLHYELSGGNEHFERFIIELYLNSHKGGVFSIINLHSICHGADIVNRRFPNQQYDETPDLIKRALTTRKKFEVGYC